MAWWGVPGHLQLQEEVARLSMQQLIPEKVSSATEEKWWWVESVQLGQAGSVVMVTAVPPLNSL